MNSRDAAVLDKVRQWLVYADEGAPGRDWFQVRIVSAQSIMG